MTTRRHNAKVALALAVGVTVGLTGCAPGEVVSGDGGASGPLEVQEINPADFAGESLSYVYFTDGPDEAATRDLIASFEEEYDVTVNLEILPYADLVTSVQARLSGGNAPDVVRLTGLGDFQNDLLDLRTYLGEDYASEFVDGPVSGATTDDGQLIAVPSDLTLNGPFINTDLFEQAGVPLPDSNDPWTWDEMIDAATKVQTATGTEYAFAMDKSGHRLSTVLSQYGTALVGDGEVVLDEAKAEAALQPLVDMMADGRMPRDFWLGSGTRYEGANEIFLAQDTPVYLSGNWQVGQFAANADFNWAAAPNPCAEECGGFPGGKYMAALKEGPNPALAAFFVQYMNTAESQEKFVAAGGFLPTRADLTEQGVTYPDRQADMDTFQADLARTPDLGYAANGDVAFNGSALELVDQLSRVVAGEKDLKTAVADVKSNAQSLVEELHK
ncbi:sugar ABC transporter substrate-binding protein [Pseudoclavibacter sp. RFBJ3]|uniref:ABC transporter substrate-binding protein n=1 Tax=unclassified Pseudoclavibacter TaxID=2615177 RepID=UPI000CE71F55|nr:MULTISPECIES: extracellular solute-binding protein [unclassified Pseudoclavibacter]MBF4550068.1 extracellular solute-binding protein [Pseudoclavibacter sp. VKM Ac-2888]PPF38493.1 sugar ABC transporter substrate-binding protein [Pseudoclavibacter sp. AY1H1]PPF74874.1 sugar ABC transporter substrate-binding protein [Pseudoclavibacter sp. Z016]PPF83890.1 sugar ABC transporter substrate-binding protein [Pseudoclavibacter sp. RFBJ5]PPF92170.1 sugar ABC transporter substrate-binding protein [Pseu